MKMATKEATYGGNHIVAIIKAASNVASVLGHGCSIPSYSRVLYAQHVSIKTVYCHQTAVALIVGHSPTPSLRLQYE